MELWRKIVLSAGIVAMGAAGIWQSLACTPAERQLAGVVAQDVAQIACTLVPVFAGASGDFAGSVCAEVAQAVGGVLNALPRSAAAMPPCTALQPLTRADGAVVG